MVLRPAERGQRDWRYPLALWDGKPGRCHADTDLAGQGDLDHGRDTKQCSGGCLANACCEHECEVRSMVFQQSRRRHDAWRSRRGRIRTPDGVAASSASSESSTEAPSASATVIPTETATQTATATPSATATSEAAQLPSSTETLTPELESSTPTPTETPTEQIPRRRNRTFEQAASPSTGFTEATAQVEPYQAVRIRHSRNSPSALAVVDRDPATYWITDVDAPPTDASFTLDFGAPVSIGSVRWLFAVAGYGDGLQIQVSNDLREWTSFDEPGAETAGDWQTLTLHQPIQARYVRFLFVNTSGGDQVGGLAEVEVLP